MTDVLVHVTIPGIAQPQGSARAFRRGARVIVTSDNPKLAGWRDRVAWGLRDAFAGHPRYDGPVHLDVAFTFVRPRGAQRRAFPAVRPDLDKCVRAIGDALTDAGVWRDDAQLVILSATKRYGEAPAVEIRAWALDGRLR